MAKRKAQPKPQEQPAPQPGLSAFNDPAKIVRVLIVVQLLFLAWQLYPWPSTNGDNAKYFALGRSLLEGTGYRQAFAPAESVESVYPIVFPALIALLGFFSDTMLLPKIFVALMSVGATLLCYHLFREMLGKLIFPLLILSATSSLTAQFGVIVMSEVPYLFFTLLAMYLLQRSLKSPENKALFWAAILVSLLPTHCRSIGIAFSGAWIIALLWGGHPRYAITHLIFLVVSTAIYKSFTSWDNPYVLHLFLKNTYDPELGYVTVGEMFQRIWANMGKYSGLVVRSAMVPFVGKVPHFVGKMFAVLLVFSIIIGWLRCLFSGKRLLFLYGLFYFGILSMWQVQWSSERFLIAILPILFLFFVLGIDAILGFAEMNSEQSFFSFFHKLKNVRPGKALSALRIRILWSVVVVLVLFNLFHHWKNPGAEKRLTPDWKNYYSCADWVRIHTPKNSVVMSRKPELFFLRSKRKGVIYPFSHDVDKVIEAMDQNRVSYVIHDNFAWTRTSAKYLYPAISQYPGKFRVVYALKNPDTFVLEYIR